ncbi:MAG: hypothetical protein CMF59_10310 [Leptospiraceae bacterium]|nr:hypothetical protein [Leptospiraceae bacterium]
MTEVASGINESGLSRRILYNGEIIRFNHPSLAELPDFFKELLSEHPLDLDIFDSALNKIYLENLNTIRKRVLESPLIRSRLLDLLQTKGWNLNNLFADQVRFRCIPADFQDHSGARGLLCWHRDTYYANPCCQINLWIPLDFCDRSNGIVFFPDLLNHPVENDSHTFDLNQWNHHGGFQAFRGNDSAVAGTGLNYPSALIQPDLEEALIPEIGPGEALIFASRHLHGTMPNTSGRNRYSLELRFCSRQDLQAADPELNIDNRSRGCFAQEFRNAADGAFTPQDLCSRYEQLTQLTDA